MCFGLEKRPNVCWAASELFLHHPKAACPPLLTPRQALGYQTPPDSASPPHPQSLPQSPKSRVQSNLRAVPTPPPAAALVLPEFQSLSAEFVEHQANVPEERVTDCGRVGGQRGVDASISMMCLLWAMPTLRRPCSSRAKEICTYRQ